MYTHMSSINFYGSAIELLSGLRGGGVAKHVLPVADSPASAVILL